MILAQQKNIPVTAPQFGNMTEALVKYRTFKNDEALQMPSLITFLSVPGAERDKFMELFTSQTVIRNNIYVKIMYS